jgi:hypothetical protein
VRGSELPEHDVSLSGVNVALHCRFDPIEVRTMKAAVSPLNLIYGCGVVFYLAEEINFAVHKSPGFIAGAIATTTKTNIFLQKIVVRGSAIRELSSLSSSLSPNCELPH